VQVLSSSSQVWEHIGCADEAGEGKGWGNREQSDQHNQTVLGLCRNFAAHRLSDVCNLGSGFLCAKIVCEPGVAGTRRSLPSRHLLQLKLEWFRLGIAYNLFSKQFAWKPDARFIVCAMRFHKKNRESNASDTCETFETFLFAILKRECWPSRSGCICAVKPKTELTQVFHTCIM
jgi:hypothetical protein